MLFYPVPQSLGCASFVARITLARKFVKNETFLVDRNAILLNGWKGSPSAVNNTRIDRTANNIQKHIRTDIVGLETLLKQVILPSVNIF